MQLGWTSGIALIDSLAVDPTPLRELMGSEHTITMHASSQDLEVLARICGRIPEVLFDTQLAAGFLGRMVLDVLHLPGWLPTIAPSPVLAGSAVANLVAAGLCALPLGRLPRR